MSKLKFYRLCPLLRPLVAREKNATLSGHIPSRSGIFPQGEGSSLRERDLPSGRGILRSISPQGAGSPLREGEAGTAPGLQENGNLIAFVPVVRKEILFAGKEENSSISPGIFLTPVPVSKKLCNPAEKPEGHVPVFAGSVAFKPSVTSERLFLCNPLAAGDPRTFQVPGQHRVLPGEFSRENTNPADSTHCTSFWAHGLADGAAVPPPPRHFSSCVCL